MKSRHLRMAHNFAVREVTQKLTSTEQQQDRQCTYNVTSRRVRETIVAVEKQCVIYLCVRACACVRVAVVARARAYVCARVALHIQHATRMRHTRRLRPPWLYHIFRHYLINGTIFRKKSY